MGYRPNEVGTVPTPAHELPDSKHPVVRKWFRGSMFPATSPELKGLILHECPSLGVVDGHTLSNLAALMECAYEAGRDVEYHEQETIKQRMRDAGYQWVKVKP